MKTHSVIIPAYNESENLRPFVSKFIKELPGTPLEDQILEIIVVENGSRDNTWDELQLLAQEYPQTVVATRIPRGSYGEAIKHGMMMAKGETLSILELDFIKPEFIIDALDKIQNQNADVVIASKRHPKSIDKRPLKRRILTRAFNMILSIATGYPGTDTHGLKAFKTSVAKELCAKAITTDEVLQTEIVIIAWKLGYKIVEVPITIQELRAATVSVTRRLPKVMTLIQQLRQSKKRFE
ncbi:MAG: glycosyltransferase family 2 protein [Candidatus Sumerlaeales bacterium]|nr:glycosyltransferase family 2 protein [Candidatus Sumerlaeales bacterium]